MTRLCRAGIISVLLLAVVWQCVSHAAEIVEHPYPGITFISRTESSPRNLSIHIVVIDLSSPGIGFELTPPGGSMETIRQTTLEFLRQHHAQIAINSHFFLPFPSANPDANLVGFAASNGVVYSGFEAPSQSYAIVANAPAINIDRENHASIVHVDPSFADGKHTLESVMIWTAISGSAQIVTDGRKTIPEYKDAQHPSGQLTPGGPGNYSNANSWYNALNARSAAGLTADNRTIILFTVDRAAGSEGMTVGEVADVLIRDYQIRNAVNLDGGGSTTISMENPATHTGSIVNVSEDNTAGRSVGSSLAVFAK